jgi:uncharacterized protein YjbI with pentapeptide repeats
MCSKNNMKIFLLSLLDQIVQLRSKLAIFMETFFQGADFYKRNFRSGSFSDCDLRGCDFRYADLSNVNLSNIKAGKSWLRVFLAFVIGLFSYIVGILLLPQFIDGVTFDLMFPDEISLLLFVFSIYSMLIFPILRSLYVDKLKNINVEIIDESNSQKKYRELFVSIPCILYLGSFVTAAKIMSIIYLGTSNPIDIVKIITENKSENIIAVCIGILLILSYLPKFIYSIMSSYFISGLTLFITSFDGAKLNGVDFSGSFLNNVSFKKASLEGANLQFSALQNAKFTSSNLKNANLQNTNLKGADFVNSNLEGVNFTNANLKGANLKGAKLDGAYYKDGNMTYHISMMSSLIIKPYSD